LFKSLKKYGYKPDSKKLEGDLAENGSDIMNDAMMALNNLKEIVAENDRLKDEIHQVIQTALVSYYDLSKYQHRFVHNSPVEDKINAKIDESISELKEIQLSQLSINISALPPDPNQSIFSMPNVKTDKNYIVRYNEILAEAKEQFVQDLTHF